MIDTMIILLTTEITVFGLKDRIQISKYSHRLSVLSHLHLYIILLLNHYKPEALENGQKKR